MLRTWLVVAALCLAPGAALAAKVGKPAPNFEIRTFDGYAIPLESLRGKVVILNYWATWCAPCRIELPQMDTYVRRHRTAPLVIYAVTIDNTTPWSRLKPLADTLVFPLVERLKGRGYGTIRGAVPTNYVIDRFGVVRYAESGAFTLESLEEIVTPMLTETSPASGAE